MEENRTQLRRSVIQFILYLYLTCVALSIVVYFVMSEVEKDNIVQDTTLERGIFTVFFLTVVSLIFYRLYRINIRVFDQRSQIFDAREAEHYSVREAARLREQFMANMSHEIRTPLNAILGFGSLLARADLRERERELANNIQTASETLLAIVNDILDFSKIEAGMLVLEKVPFDLHGLLHSLRQMFSEKAQQKSLKLEFHLDPDLPENLVGDPTRLTQIWVNLLGNALKFTEQGSVTVEVSALPAAAPQQSVIRIVIRDTGIGIPGDQLERVFERFTQSDEQTTRIYGGTGLGLSIVKQLVTAMQGSVTVQSEVGVGSTFIVVLPFGLAPERTANQHLPAASMPSLEWVDATNPHLLVAEDNPMNRRVVELLFDEWKFRYTIVHNGRLAVELLAAHPTAYDLVLMDIQMPEMDGYEATRQIRHTLGLGLPIVAMTAHALAGEREKCLRLGMNDYISKPFREQELRQIVARFALSGTETAAPAMDYTYLRETTLGNADFQRELAGIFLAQVPRDLDSLAAALSAGDWVAAAKAAHNMKSTVGYMGFAQNIGQQLANFEQMCHQQDDLALLWAEFERIRAVAEQATTLVKKEFSDTP